MSRLDDAKVDILRHVRNKVTESKLTDRRMKTIPRKLSIKYKLKINKKNQE